MPEPKEPKQPKAIASSVEEFKYMQQIYQNQYMAIANEMNARAEVLKDLDGALKVLEEINNIKGRETLFSISSGAFTNGKITNSDSIVVSVGAGYLVEKNTDDAKGYISKAMNRETDFINKLNKSKKEIESALIEISYKIEELSH